MSKAVVLLSGGMDSAVTAAIAKQEHDEVIALNMFYGQRHAHERKCARQIVAALGLDAYIEMDLSDVFSQMKSALIMSANIEINDAQPKDQVGATYVPARNSIFLSVAAGIADTHGAKFIYYGAHAEDHNGYPDCRPDYYLAMSEALKRGTVNGIIVVAPFINKHKSDIVKRGVELGVPFGRTHSCYRGEYPACGTCPTCQVRLQAFYEAGVTDPLPYKHGAEFHVKGGE